MIRTLRLIIVNLIFFQFTIAQQLTIGVVQISYTNRGSQTDFVVTSNFGGSINVQNAWLGIGFNSVQGMVK